MMSPSRWERAAFWSAMLGFEVIDERPYSNGRHPATGRHDQPLPHTRTQTSLSIIGVRTAAPPGQVRMNHMAV